MLNYLKNRVLTGKGDRILSMGAKLPREMADNMSECQTLAEVSGKYKLIVADNALSEEYKYTEHFALAASLLDEKGFYVLTQRITGQDDAWTNALLSTVDAAHVRSPRADEVISAAAEHLELTEFIRSIKLFSYPMLNEALLEKQITEFPKNVFKRTEPVMHGGKLTVKQLVGLFIWQK
jgi:hypothetical protein